VNKEPLGGLPRNAGVCETAPYPHLTLFFLPLFFLQELLHAATEESAIAVGNSGFYLRKHLTTWTIMLYTIG
jgi:hypothetical protein